MNALLLVLLTSAYAAQPAILTPQEQAAADEAGYTEVKKFSDGQVFYKDMAGQQFKARMEHGNFTGQQYCGDGGCKLPSSAQNAPQDDNQLTIGPDGIKKQELPTDASAFVDQIQKQANAFVNDNPDVGGAADVLNPKDLREAYSAPTDVAAPSAQTQGSYGVGGAEAVGAAAGPKVNLATYRMLHDQVLPAARGNFLSGDPYQHQTGAAALGACNTRADGVVDCSVSGR